VESLAGVHGVPRALCQFYMVRGSGFDKLISDPSYLPKMPRTNGLPYSSKVWENIEIFFFFIIRVVVQNLTETESMYDVTCIWSIAKLCVNFFDIQCYFIISISISIIFKRYLYINPLI
jgi:hypothetical protein